MREITSKVHSSADADTILRTAVREVSTALGRQAYIYLGEKEEEQQEGTQGDVQERHPPIDRSLLGPEGDTNTLNQPDAEENDA